MTTAILRIRTAALKVAPRQLRRDEPAAGSRPRRARPPCPSALSGRGPLVDAAVGEPVGLPVALRGT